MYESNSLFSYKNCVVFFRGPPKGLLLFGPPGTGKTLIGRWPIIKGYRYLLPVPIFLYSWGRCSFWRLRLLQSFFFASLAPALALPPLSSGWESWKWEKNNNKKIYLIPVLDTCISRTYRYPALHCYRYCLHLVRMLPVPVPHLSEIVQSFFHAFFNSLVTVFLYFSTTTTRI